MISAKEIFQNEITIRAVNHCFYGRVYDVLFNGYGWNDIKDAGNRTAAKYYAAKLAVRVAAERNAEPEFLNDLY